MSTPTTGILDNYNLRYNFGTAQLEMNVGAEDWEAVPTNLGDIGLANGKILVGNGSGVATAVTLSGGGSLSNTGVLTLTNSSIIGAVLTGYVSGAGTVASTDTILQAINKLNGNTAAKISSTLTSAHLLVGNVSNIATDVALSGDATLSNTGALALATVNGNVGSFTSANITVDAKGRITAAANGGGGGSVTPSVQVISIANTENLTTGYITTDLTSTFALSNSSHKVKITIWGQLEMNGNTNVGYATIKMDSTDLDTTGNGFMQVFPEGAATGALGFGGISFLASPGDTASHTYALFIKNDVSGGSNSCHWNNFPGSSTLILEEIA